jgi:hypothetical protein
MPEAGVCIATGFNNLIAIDIDDEELVAPILAVLPSVMVAKRRQWGQTIFVRSIEPMPSTPYNGPDLGRPYEWLTPATLLNTPLEALPVFTDAHREAMEESSSPARLGRS